MILQVFLFIRFVFGIAPELICYFDLIVKPGIAMVTILFLDAIAIVRYIFVFHRKNPTVTQDDFWNCFICIWVIGICLIYYLVFVLLPGNNPNFFFVCLGRIPSNFKSGETKVNLGLQYLLHASVLAHVFVGVRYFVFKRQEKKKIATGN